MVHVHIGQDGFVDLSQKVAPHSSDMDTERSVELSGTGFAQQARGLGVISSTVRAKKGSLTHRLRHRTCSVTEGKQDKREHQAYLAQEALLWDLDAERPK